MSSFSNIEAEKDLLSVILCSPEIIIEKADKIKKDIFSHLFHQRMVKKIIELIIESAPIEVSTITNVEKEQEYLEHLKERRRKPEDFDHFYSVLEDCFVRRRLVDITSEAQSRLADERVSDGSEILHKVRKELENIDEFRSSTIYTASDIVDDVLNRHLELIEKIKNGEEYKRTDVIQTPLGTFNKFLKGGGLPASSLIVLAATPSTGKTELALNIASFVAIDLDKCAFVYSLEMDKESLVERILQERAKVDSQKLSTGIVNEVELQRLKLAARDIRGSRLIFEDNLSGDIYDIISSIRKAHNKHKLDIVVVDYLQLIKTTDTKNRAEELGTITRLLKQESVKLKVPFVVLSQLSRAHLHEKREPELRDLRESGSIEQDADVVLFLHTSNKERKKPKVRTKAILGKQRNGPIGEFYLLNNKNIQLFTEIRKDEYEEGQDTHEIIEEESNSDVKLDNLPF